MHVVEVHNLHAPEIDIMLVHAMMCCPAMCPCLPIETPYVCCCRRSRSLLSSHEGYELYLESNNTLLLAARRKRKGARSTCAVALDMEHLKKGSKSAVWKVGALTRRLRQQQVT